MKPVTTQNMVEYIRCTGAALDLAKQAEERATKQAADLQTNAPVLAALLAKNGFIPAGSEKQAADALIDPVKTQEILRRIIEKSAAAKLGTPLVEKKASSPRKPTITGDMNWHDSPADQASRAHFGIV